jgi:2-amino-4-hydroxy-6-hydroxymethyldihydropteridine diphosphokinase
MARCLIGCGSNQGNRREHLDRALELLRYMPGLTLLATSVPRETKPVGGPFGQAPFLNAACLLETDVAPHDLLGMLAAIENTLHRERGDRWGPRTIDLDLLLYDDLVIDDDLLTLPHPRMTTRRFVLEPCAEIAGDAVHPLAGCSLKTLLENISHPHPHVAVVGVPGAGASEVAEALADAILARLIHARIPPIGFAEAVPDASAATDPEADADRRVKACLEAVAEAAGPLSRTEWPRDTHGTVTDYWLGTLPLAVGGSLGPPARERLESAFARVAAGTVAPNVVLMLVATPETLEERIAFRSRTPAPQTDIFSDLGPAIAACADSRELARRLLELQERILCRLRDQNGSPAAMPKAVVLINAADLGAAAGEAVAAVEAMS